MVAVHEEEVRLRGARSKVRELIDGLPQASTLREEESLIKEVWEALLHDAFAGSDIELRDRPRGSVGA